MRADASGQFLQAILIETLARVGGGFSEQRERQVAVLGGGGINDGHGLLLSSGWGLR